MEALAAAMHPVSLAELENKLLSIDKSGIYRTLTTFKEHHLVHALEGGAGDTVYELCLSHDIHHDDDAHVHFFCEQCRQTFCLDNIALPEVAVPDGFIATSANYMVKGICPECSRKHRNHNI